MPTSTPSVADLVGQSVKESLATTPSEAATTTTPEAKPDATLPAYLPEEIRDRLTGLDPKTRESELAWYKKVYGDYQRKSAELAREREELKRPPAAPSPTVDVTAAKAKVETYFDRLIAGETDAGVKRNLEELRSGILELTQAPEILAELKALKTALAEGQRTAQTTREAQVLEELQTVSAPFQPLVEKYQARILKLAAEFPTADLETLLQYSTPPKEYREALKAQLAEDDRAASGKETARLKALGLPTPPQGSVADGQPTTPERLKPSLPWFAGRYDIRRKISEVVPEVLRKGPGG